MKGFIGIGLIITIVASALVGGIVSFFSSKVIYEQKIENILGATITTTTLSDTIGTFRTNVNSALENINDQLTSSTAVNPGHLHTTSGISSTIAVAQGGTATATFLYGLVIASSTNAFTTLRPTSNGQIPIASGTTWIANTLTAGSNITITNAAGSITIAAGASSSALIAASSSPVSVFSSTATTTLLSFSVATNTLVGTNAIKLRANFSRIHLNTAGDEIAFTGTYGSSTVIRFQIRAGQTDNVTGYLEAIIQAAGVSNSQYGTASLVISTRASVTSTIELFQSSRTLAFGITTSTASVSVTSSQDFVLLVKNSANGVNNGVTLDSYLAERISN